MRFISALLVLIFYVQIAKSEIELLDRSGKEIPLDKSRLTIINFMAYSCGHCMAEIPIFKKVLSKPQFKERFVIYGFALDGKENNFKDKEFTIYANNPKNNVIFPVLGTPTTYIVSPEGKKLHVIYGSVTEESLERFLNESLRKYRK